MKAKLFLTILLLFCSTIIKAAPFKNIEKILTQPDGTTLRCYASGDEFYNRLHDSEGYTIVQAENGYFVYASTDKNGEIIATQHIAGKSDPKALGLKSNIAISKKEYLKRRDMMSTSANRAASGLNHGTYNNLVVFIKFNGDSDFTTPKSEIDSMLNNKGYYDISMNNYFKKITYNQLSMNSYCYPKSDSDKILAYEDIYPRNYYRPYNATSNPDGYKENERGPREFALLKRAIEHIADEVPDTLNIDRNNDGLVDNVIFIVKGNVGDWSDLLWPHMWELHSEDAYINNKKVLSFNFQLETCTYFTVSTLCHEMAHSLGFPDLYHYDSPFESLSPTGPWDLMCNNAQPPQHTATYMKYKYGTWIKDIPVIDYGTYTIEANSWEGGRRNCYKIPTSDPNQFYLVEYRNSNNLFETGLPDGGLLIYRLDRRFNGCVKYNGDDILDELYVFRPDGAYNKNGKINLATFSKDNQRTEFNSTTNPTPFLNLNETDEIINICNISAIGDQMTFSYLPANSDIIPNNFLANVKKDQYIELKWDTVAKADSYNIYRNGTLIANNVTNIFYKDEYQNLSEGYNYYYVTSDSNGEESFRSNIEDIIVGDYCEYIFSMNCSDENGWQGGEITLSFDNGMEDRYLTIYSGNEKKESVVVPAGIKMSVNWTSGWDDSKCSFAISNNNEEIYKSGILKDGLLIDIDTEGENTCIRPQNLSAKVSGYHVDLHWCSHVECDSYTILRNDEIIAEDITSNFYTDKTANNSGTHTYTVISKYNDCISAPSDPATATILKYNQKLISATATLVENKARLDWNISTSETSTLNYDDGKYVTSIGSSNNSWGIKIPKEKLNIYKNAKITAIEIFDAAEASYNFDIYNGEAPKNNVLIHNETFRTTNTNDFVTFPLSQKISFDINNDLWLIAKYTSSSNSAIPCGNFVNNANSNIIKIGSSWKSASDYGMNYSWLIRLHIELPESTINEFSYNIYRQDELIAYNLKSTTYTDSVIIKGNVCYNIEATLDNIAVINSDDLCLTTAPENDEASILYPNPTSDNVTIKDKNIKNVKIYSVTGSILFEGDYNCDELQIDMKKFGCGIYVILITTETDTKVSKIIVY